MAVKDKDKIEMFKQLLKITMKNHETELSIFFEICDNVESDTKAVISTKVDFKQLGILVTTKDFDEFLKEKNIPGQNKICF